MIDLQWKKIHEHGQQPTQAYPGDAGWDLYSCEDRVIWPSDAFDVRTGICVAIPEGFWGRICGRSSSIRKRGLFVHEGVIDAGFRGELFAFAQNFAHTKIEIKQGERIAQLILVEIPERQTWRQVDELPESARGESGFGSSGR